MDEIVLSVSEIVGKLKRTIEREFHAVSVTGEITNFSSSASGHFYFNLSDARAGISCALFRMNAARNREVGKLKDGVKVIASGNIGIYSKRGSLQLIVEKITVVSGEGELKEKFEKLKKKLAAEGLFDLDQKQKIPPYPRRIAVITSRRGAALQDFLQVTRRRTAWMDILLAPALVQGEEAPKSLQKALHLVIKYHLQATENKKLDAIVLTRGGGSLEDLWCFNDEALAWDLYNCPLPVISAVGHEVDFSIADMVADFRAETPTAAAEILSESQARLLENFHHLRQSLLKAGRENLYRKKMQVEIGARLLEFKSFYEEALRLEDFYHQLLNIVPGKSQLLAGKLDKSGEALRLLNPANILDRGYCYLQDEEGAVITRHKKFALLAHEQLLSLKFGDGVGFVQKIDRSTHPDLKLRDQSSPPRTG